MINRPLAPFPYCDPSMGALDALLRLYLPDLAPAALAAWQQGQAAFIQAQNEHREALAVVHHAILLEEADRNLGLTEGYAREGDLSSEEAAHAFPEARTWKQQAEAALFVALRGDVALRPYSKASKGSSDARKLANLDDDVAF